MVIILNEHGSMNDTVGLVRDMTSKFAAKPIRIRIY